MSTKRRGDWVYIMADRYRDTMYIGVTADHITHIFQYRTGDGSDFCARCGLDRLVWADRSDTIDACIAHEKRINIGAANGSSR